MHVIPCVEGRTDGKPAASQASTWGSIVPATWSFMLACRARGLGTSWTTFHLQHEREAAELLGIPYDAVMQAALVPVAYTLGTDFKPGRRAPLETMVHWDDVVSQPAVACASDAAGTSLRRRIRPATSRPMNANMAPTQNAQL